MITEKTLSVIIPTYNMENYLRKCLDSLIISENNMRYLEVLIINDGSKDSSLKIAQEYELKFNQTFRVIDKDNGNYGSCINRGLKEAKGKYVKVLDADDYYDKSILDDYISFLRETDVDMILTDYNHVNPEGKVIGQVKFPYDHKLVMNVIDKCEDNVFVHMQMHGVTYKLRKLIDNNYVQTTGVSYTDQEWVFMPIVFMNTFCHYKGFLYQYLLGREGQTVDPTIASKHARVKMELLYKRIDQYNTQEKLNILPKAKMVYLKNRILATASALYKFSIIHKQIGINEIEKFDKELKALNENVYKELETSHISTYSSFSFVGYWRKNHKSPLIIRLLREVRKVMGIESL